MKTRVYSHAKRDYVEFELGKYTTSDIERVKAPLFTACGKNCFLKVYHIPDGEKEERMLSYFTWQRNMKSYYYTVEANYAVIDGIIQQYISEETFKELDEFLSQDRKEYEQWMSAH